MDIVFGECVALGGHRYNLILVDVATSLLLAIQDVVPIIKIYLLHTITIQIRRGMLNPTVTIRLRQKINWWQCPTLDPLEWFQHHCRSFRTQIFKWIRRTHMEYSNTNGESIHHIKASRKIILVLCGSTCRNDAQPSSWPLRPETQHTV